MIRLSLHQHYLKDRRHLGFILPIVSATLQGRNTQLPLNCQILELEDASNVMESRCCTLVARWVPMMDTTLFDLHGVFVSLFVLSWICCRYLKMRRFQIKIKFERFFLKNWKLWPHSSMGTTEKQLFIALPEAKIPTLCLLMVHPDALRLWPLSWV